MAAFLVPPTPAAGLYIQPLLHYEATYVDSYLTGDIGAHHSGFLVSALPTQLPSCDDVSHLPSKKIFVLQPLHLPRQPRFLCRLFHSTGCRIDFVLGFLH